MALQLLAGAALPVMLVVGVAQPTTVRLGDASAAPGSRVVVPLSLGAADGVQVGSIDIQLSYPRALLTFVKMQPSGLSVGAGVRIETTVESGGDAKTATLRASVSSAAAPLPAGPLAYLEFTIDKRAKPQTTIELIPAATAVLAGQPRAAVAPLTAAKAKITVAGPPVPACFFYMH